MGEVFEETVFAARDRLIVAGLRDAPGRRVDNDIAKGDHRDGGTVITTDQRAETGEQFLLHVRFRDIIIGAEIQAGDAIIDRVAGREHHDGRPLGVPEAAQHFAPVHHRH